MPKIFKSSGQYGIKRSGKFGKLSAAERAEMNLQRGLYDDGKKVTAQMQKDLDALFKEIRNKTNAQLAQLRQYEQETGRSSPSLMTDIYTNPKTNEQKILEILRGKSFLEDETSTVEGTKDYFDFVGDDLDDFLDEIDETGGIDRDKVIRRILDLHPEKSSSEIADTVDYYIQNADGLLSEDELTIFILETIENETNSKTNFDKNSKEFR